MLVNISINGEMHSHDVEPRLLLVHYIREYAELHGTHWGCDTSNCGICIVLMDDPNCDQPPYPVKSCTMLAAMAEGYEIVTVEGMAAPDGTLDPDSDGLSRDARTPVRLLHPGHDVHGSLAHREAP